MTAQFVTVERQDRIAIIRFDRGDRANAFSRQLIRELTDVAHGLVDDRTVSAVVLTGRADVFTLGADLKEAAASQSAEAGLGERRVALRAGPRLCAAWEALDAITIVAIEGWCVGGGAALAAACDLRVMGRSAHLYVPEIERGMNMSWGSVPRFVSLCGPARTKRIISLAEKVPAEQALHWGLADAVAEDGQAVEAAMGFARRAAELPPLAVAMSKQDVNAAATALHGVASHRDLEGFALTQTSEDFEEGIKAFLEGRPPRFTGD